MSQPTLVLIRPENLDRAMEMGAEDLLREVCDRSNGEWVLEDLAEKVRTGADGMFVVVDGEEVVCVVLASIVVFSNERKIFKIYILTGRNRNSWLHHKETIYDYARSRGCDKVRALVRPGWARDLPDWKKTHILLERDLSDG